MDDDRLKSIRWARPAADIPEDEQLGLNELLQALQFLGVSTDRQSMVGLGAWAPTPASMQVIKTGVLGVTRSVTRWVAVAGGLSSVSAAAVAWLGDMEKHLGSAGVVALLAGAALIIAASFVSIAWVVAADIRARAEATAARYQARAQVAATVLASTARLSDPAAPPGAPAAAGPGLRTGLNHGR